MLHVLVYNMSSDYMIKRLYCFFFFFNPCSGVEITINAKLNLDPSLFKLKVSSFQHQKAYLKLRVFHSESRNLETRYHK